MTAVSDFLRDPAQFMRANHVTYKGGYPSQQGGAEHDFILLRMSEHARVRSQVFLGMSLRKADAGVYQIRCRSALPASDPRLAQGEGFRAVWGGYVPGGKVECALGSGGAGIMLTPELTGCTVAFASQINGDARFSHYNLVGADHRTLGASAMVAEARSDYAGAGNVGVLTKEHYHGKSKAGADAGQRMTAAQWAQHRSRPAANVVGWRVDGRWTFWIQYVDMKGSVNQILAVKKLTPGVKIG